MGSKTKLSPVSYIEARQSVRILDQRLLPKKELYRLLKTPAQIIDAIRSLSVRGAPLLGVIGAYSVAIAIKYSNSYSQLDKILGEMIGSRPTAVNLSWAIKSIRSELKGSWDKRKLSKQASLQAKKLHEEDQIMCKSIGLASRKLIKRNSNILTICNTGALATGGQGTAFSCFIENRPKNITVYAMETRPLLQGSRLTMYELRKHRIKSYLICDSAAAITMKNKKIDIIITGADRVARNGDTANKIGTFQIALCAKQLKIPFYIACPSSTIDLTLTSGFQIKIEERKQDELLAPLGKPSLDYKCYTPAFDITPAKLIAGIITEKGIIKPGQIRNVAIQ